MPRPKKSGLQKLTEMGWVKTGRFKHHFAMTQEYDGVPYYYSIFINDYGHYDTYFESRGFWGTFKLKSRLLNAIKQYAKENDLNGQ